MRLDRTRSFRGSRASSRRPARPSSSPRLPCDRLRRPPQPRPARASRRTGSSRGQGAGDAGRRGDGGLGQSARERGRAGHPARRAATRWTPRWRWASRWRWCTPRRATSAAAASWSSAPRDGTVQHARLPGDRAGRARRATCISTPHGEPTDRSVTGHLAAGVPGAVGRAWSRRIGATGELPFARGHRAGHPAGARRLRGGRLPEPSRSAGDSARLAPFPASRATFLPGRRVRPPPGTAAAPARPGRDARGDPRPRRGRLLPRPGGGPDRGRDGARRRADPP